ncbi:MAG: hypothetical protein ACXWWP_00275, partial [Candidatus Binatia bacterium]
GFTDGFRGRHGQGVVGHQVYNFHPRFLLKGCCTRYRCSVRAKLSKKIIAGVGAIAALTRRLVFTNENIAMDLRNAAKTFR